ncbi:MAG: hypothetical protein Q8920_08240 [Bacillota bacterium]|nr:hypothetical protein [Bacillota bacterium]
MVIYSIIAATMVIVSSLVFALILHKHKSLDINNLMVIILSSVFVFVLSMIFPFLFAAIINLVTKGGNYVRIAAGISILLFLYILIVVKFVSFIMDFQAQKKAVKVREFLGYVLEEGLFSYFSHKAQNLPKRRANGAGVFAVINDIGSDGTVAVKSPNTENSSVKSESRESFKQHETREQKITDIADNTEELLKEYNSADNAVAEVSETIPDNINDNLEDEASELLEINEDTDLKPADGISAEVMQVLEQAASNNVVEDNEEDQYIKAAMQAANIDIEIDSKESALEPDEPAEIGIKSEDKVYLPENEDITATDIDSVNDIIDAADPQENDEISSAGTEYRIEQAAEEAAPATELQLNETLTESEQEVSIDQYIDMAFSFKEKGDFESAILNYMYALDKKPDDNLVFWVILDICVLYKEMGQTDLAREILESYVDSYGHVMDPAVRVEIERNLA